LDCAASLRSIAPPGGCGCFNLNGGSATFAWTVKPGCFARMGDAITSHAGATATGESLILSAFTAGARYLPWLGRSLVQPFGQALIGLEDSTGTLVQGTANPASANVGAAYAAKLGGGLDRRSNSRFSSRLIDADYLVTIRAICACVVFNS
jgi:peptidoglycan-associated lipoprotein